MIDFIVLNWLGCFGETHDGREDWKKRRNSKTEVRRKIRTTKIGAVAKPNGPRFFFLGAGWRSTIRVVFPDSEIPTELDVRVWGKV